MSSCPKDIAGAKIWGLEGSRDPKEKGTKTASSQACDSGRHRRNTSGEVYDQLPTPNGTGEVGSLTGICHPKAPLEFDSLHDTLWNS